MTDKRTSTDWETICYLFDALSGESFGQALHALGPVKVHLGAPPATEVHGEESIRVHTIVDSPSEQTYLTAGPGTKEETFGLQVTVSTNVAGKTARDAGDRLNEMRAVVEEFIRGIGSLLASGQARKPDIDAVKWWWVNRGEFAVVPTDQGYRGVAHLYITVRARI